MLRVPISISRTFFCNVYVDVPKVHRLREVVTSSTIAHDNGTHGAMARKILNKNHSFGNANRINSVNFNATTLKLAAKFDHQFSHLFIFRNIFVQGHGFDAVTVAMLCLFSLH